MLIGELIRIVQERMDWKLTVLAPELGVSDNQCSRMRCNKQGADNKRNKRALLSILMEDVLGRIEEGGVTRSELQELNTLIRRVLDEKELHD